MAESAVSRPKLTGRQREVFALVAEGLSNREIADRLGITLDGAKWHVSELLGRLDVEDREQLAALWPQHRREPVTAWIRKPAIAIAAGVGGLAVAAVALFAVLSFRGDDSNPATVDASPTPDAAACPVDVAICEFAKRVEFEFREGDPKTLLSEKSSFYPDSGVINAGIGGWRERPLYPYVVGIGCSIEPAGGVCQTAFSLVLTAQPEGQQLERIDRVILGFLRDGDDLPIVTTNRLAGGSFNPVTAGVDSGDCGLSGITDGLPCAGTRFFPYMTGDPIARPAATPAPTAPAVNGPDPLAGIDPLVLQPGMQSSIGHDTVVYYSTGCFACGRPQIPNLYRAYRSSTGELRTDDLLGPLLAKTGGYPHDVVANWERGQLLVLICATGYCGGEGDPSPDAQVQLFASRDGGITWNEQPPDLQPGTFLIGSLGSELLIGKGERRGLDFVVRYFLYPSMREATPPPGVGSAESVIGPDGALTWRTYGPARGAFDERGELIVGSAQERPLVRLIAMEPGWLAQWQTDGTPGSFFGLIDGSGQVSRLLRHDHYFAVRGQLPTGLLYANVELPEAFGFGIDAGSTACKQQQHVYPALVDINRGTIHPIFEFQDCFEGRHAFVNAIVTGPFVRVNTGADCLNLRTEPNTASQRLDCLADGVLLPVRLEGTPPSAPGWIPVFTPNYGDVGWVSEEFVAR